MRFLWGCLNRFNFEPVQIPPENPKSRTGCENQARRRDFAAAGGAPQDARTTSRVGSTTAHWPARVEEPPGPRAGLLPDSSRPTDTWSAPVATAPIQCREAHHRAFLARLHAQAAQAEHRPEGEQVVEAHDAGRRHAFRTARGCLKPSSRVDGHSITRSGASFSPASSSRRRTRRSGPCRWTSAVQADVSDVAMAEGQEMPGGHARGLPVVVADEIGLDTGDTAGDLHQRHAPFEQPFQLCLGCSHGRRQQQASIAVLAQVPEARRRGTDSEQLPSTSTRPSFRARLDVRRDVGVTVSDVAHGNATIRERRRAAAPPLGRT